MLINRSENLSPVHSDIRGPLYLESQRMGREGIKVLRLNTGNPATFGFPMPESVRKALLENADKAVGYCDFRGMMPAREAIVEYHLGKGFKDITVNDVFIGNGVSELATDTLMALLNYGDEILIPTPSYSLWTNSAYMAGAKPVFYRCDEENEWNPDLEDLKSKITPKTRALILCSPSNPTGSVYSRDELAALAEVLARHEQVYVIADEIYEHISYCGQLTSIASFPEMKDRVVIINGVSKAYAMTGWRIGFCACPAYIAKAVTKLQGQYTSGCSSIAQKAAEAAYNGSQECVEVMRQAFERRRDLIFDLVQQIPGFKLTDKPEGAFYVFPKVSELFGKQTPEGQVISNANDLAMYILEHGHVAGVSGDAFGAPESIRFSYATSEDKITEAMRRVKEAVERLA
mgnify:CR=1 FL=1